MEVRERAGWIPGERALCKGATVGAKALRQKIYQAQLRKAKKPVWLEQNDRDKDRS